MSNMQAWVDGMSAQWQKDRATSQMTLGRLIKELSAVDPDREITGLGALNSYRGYYCDLSFEPSGPRKVSDLLKECEDAMGQIFHGYKGGDYMMGANTPLWTADYGRCGDKIMSLDLSQPTIRAVTLPDEG